MLILTVYLIFYVSFGLAYLFECFPDFYFEKKKKERKIYQSRFQPQAVNFIFWTKSENFFCFLRNVPTAQILGLLIKDDFESKIHLGLYLSNIANPIIYCLTGLLNMEQMEIIFRQWGFLFLLFYQNIKINETFKLVVI